MSGIYLEGGESCTGLYEGFFLFFSLFFWGGEGGFRWVGEKNSIFFLINIYSTI